MDNKIHIYAKINEDVKNRATMYVTQSKLLETKTKTMSQLIEESLDYYMMNHPL